MAHEDVQERDPGARRRTFAWVVAFVAVVSAASGFANASASQPAEVVTETVTVHETVTEYRTVPPPIDPDAVTTAGAGAVNDLASERQRLNRIKRNLNARREKLDRRRAALDAREARIAAREGDDLAVAGARATPSAGADGRGAPPQRTPPE